MEFERLKEDIRNIEYELEYGEEQNAERVAVNVNYLRSVIDFANEAITALQQYQPWIPVGERLPEEGAIVMVAYGEAIYFASIQYWGTHGKEVPVWRVGMGHRIEKDFSETHWKPYPETPKGE